MKCHLLFYPPDPSRCCFVLNVCPNVRCQVIERRGVGAMEVRSVSLRRAAAHARVGLGQQDLAAAGLGGIPGCGCGARRGVHGVVLARVGGAGGDAYI